MINYAKLVGILLAVLLIVASVGAGYHYVKSLQEANAKLTSDLAVQTFRAESYLKLSEHWLNEHARAAERLQALESARTTLEAEIAAERARNESLNLEEGMSHDADQAVRNLTARNDELNRMLERRSEAGRDRR